MGFIKDLFDFSDLKRNKEPMCSELEAKQVGKQCPQCGETRGMFECLSNSDKFQGIMGGVVSDETNGFFDCHIYHRYHYHCYTCGCHWQSPRFQYQTNKTMTVFPK